MSSPTTPWIKATASGGNGGDCVEMRTHDGRVEVRDTKDRGTGPTLRLTTAGFAAWRDGARRGEFDHLSR